METEQRGGTLTNLSTVVGSTIQSFNVAQSQGWRYRRLIWASSNTFYSQVSRDGVNYRQIGPLSHTLTPTQFGIGITVWGGAGAMIGAYEFAGVRRRPPLLKAT